MNRIIVYPGSIPLDTDILNPQRNAMVALGALIQAALGTGTYVSGLAASQTTAPSMTINIGAGSIVSLQPVDATAYGSLAADAGDSIMKQGINLAAVPFTLTAPSTSGQSINYVIEAAFVENDGTPVVLPYVNPANPSQPYSGPANAGTAQNTTRSEVCQLQLKPGAAATTGTQTTPGTDTGYVPLYVITVNYGQTTITTAQIAIAPGAPFLYQPQKSFYGGTGYARRSIDGFIEQGGVSTTSSAGTVTINLPIPFTTGSYSITGTVTGSPTYIVGNVQVGSVTVVNGQVTAITFVTGGTTSGNAGPISFYWEAKGY